MEWFKTFILFISLQFGQDSRGTAVSASHSVTWGVSTRSWGSPVKAACSCRWQGGSSCPLEAQEGQKARTQFSFYVWALPQHGGPVLRANIPKELGSYIAFYDLASEVTWCHFHCSHKYTQVQGQGP